MPRALRHVLLLIICASVLLAGVADARAAIQWSADDVAGDGNLWQINADGDVHRVTPAGVKTTFDLPAGRKADTLAAERGSDRIWLLTHDPAQPQSSMSVMSVTTAGQFSAAPGIPLGFRFIDKGPGLSKPRYMTVTADREVWVSRSWNPCVGGSGDIYRVQPVAGTVRRFESPSNRQGNQAKVAGPIMADRHGRVWAKVLIREDTDESKCTSENDTVSYSTLSTSAFFTSDEQLWGEYQLRSAPSPCGLGGDPFASDSSGEVWCATTDNIKTMVADILDFTIFRNLPQSLWVLDGQDTEADAMMFYRQQPTNDPVSHRYLSINAAGEIRDYPQLAAYGTFLPFPDDPTFVASSELQVSPAGAWWMLSQYDVIASGAQLDSRPVLATIPREHRRQFPFLGADYEGLPAAQPFTPRFPPAPDPSGYCCPLPPAVKTKVPAAKVLSVRLTRTSVTVRANVTRRLRVRIEPVRANGKVRPRGARTVTVTTRAGKAVTRRLRRLAAGRWRVTVTSDARRLHRSTVRLKASRARNRR